MNQPFVACLFMLLLGGASASPTADITLANSVNGITQVNGSSDSVGNLVTTSAFDMLGGNTVALILTTEGGGSSTVMSATYAGQMMNVVRANEPGQSSTIFYLINPSNTVGAFNIKLDANISSLDYAYSQLSLSNVGRVADSDTFHSTVSDSSAPMELQYTTVNAGGWVLGAAVNNDYNDTKNLYVTGNPDSNLLSFTRVDNSGHFHTIGSVETAGSHTDSYYKQYGRNAAVTVAFGIAMTWYVDAQTGDDSAGGLSPADAFQTIQTAVDVAKPGDRILVGSGVYHENIVLEHGGTAGAPIEIVASDSGCYRTVLSGAVASVRRGDVTWELVDSSRLLYRIPLDYRPVRVLADFTDLSAYESLDDLKAFHFVADDYPGNPHGFAWDATTQSLYVRLRADGKYSAINPNDAIMSVAPPTAGGTWGVTPNRSDNFLITLNIPGSAHVVIDGFTFETPGLAGIYAYANDLAVCNSWFYGCRYGVMGQEDGSTARVNIENCFYTQYPAYSDAEDILRTVGTSSSWSIIHWQRKTGFLSSGLARPYSYETGLIRRIGNEWMVRNNYIWESFEAFSSGSVSESLNSVIENNRIERICDNACETEEHAEGLTIRGNQVVDVFEPFSWQPLSGIPLPGPIYIYDNLIWQSPEDMALWEGISRGGIFKIGIKGTALWDNGLMGNIPTNQTPAPGGFWVAHNTVLGSYKRMFTALNPIGRLYEQFFFMNNIIEANSFASQLPGGPEGVVYFGNAIYFEQTNTAAALIAAGEDGLVDGDGFSFAELALTPEQFTPPSNSILATSGWTNRAAFQTSYTNLTIPDSLPLRTMVGVGTPFSHVGPTPVYLVWSADFESYDTSGGATGLTLNATGHDDTFSAASLIQTGANIFIQNVLASSVPSGMTGNALQIKMVNTSAAAESGTKIQLLQHNLPSLKGSGVYILSCDLAREGTVNISSMTGHGADTNGVANGSSSSSYNSILANGTAIRYTLVINQSAAEMTLPGTLGTLSTGSSATYLYDGTNFLGLSVSSGVTSPDIAGFSAGHNRSGTIASGAALTVWYDNFGVWNSASATVEGVNVLELVPGTSGFLKSSVGH